MLRRQAPFLRVSLILLLVGAALAACAAEPSTPASLPLDPAKSVYVARPDEVLGGRVTALDSGRAVADRIAFTMREQGQRQVEVAPREARDPAELLVLARRAGASYLVQPTILSWEPATHAAMTHAFLMVVRLRVTVLDVTTGRELSSADLTTQTYYGILGFLGIGMPPNPVLDGYVRGLYRAKP